MLCYVHALANEEVQAVMVCKDCGAAICMEHVLEMQAHRPGGMEMGCDHLVKQPQATPTGRPAEVRRNVFG